MKINDLYQQVTDSIVKELEEGAAPWAKPWTRRGPKMPLNYATRRPYSGINVVILWMTCQAKLYPTMEFLTFKQALEKGGCVRKGEKGTTVVFMKQIVVGEEDDERRVGMLKSFTVFNRSQIDGIEALPPPEPPTTPVHAFVSATEAKILEGFDEAFFSPGNDAICVPRMAQFRGEEHYHATLLHELTHWSGHKTRLDRDLSGRFGSQKYAAEELVAELGAAFLCAHLGIQGELRHAGYLESWLTLLKDDNRAIFTASAKAQQAANYLRSFSEEAPTLDAHYEVVN